MKKNVMNNLKVTSKKGMSTVIVTIIMIVLVLGAVGVIWGIVGGVLDQGTSDASLSGKCIKANLVATKMICEGATCDVTLNRKVGGGDAIGGAKLIFKNTDSGNLGTTVGDFSGNIAELGTNVAEGIEHGLTDELPNSLDVTIYFLSDSETEQLCPQSRTFKF